MTQRLIVFTDPDDNTLLVELGDDRVQLSAVDSQPALAGDELHRFVGELFRHYAAPKLRAQLAEAEAALERARAAVHALVEPDDAAVTHHRRAPRPRRASSAYARAWQRPTWLPAELPVDELLAYRRGAWPPVPITSFSGRPR